jgi:hypothetical protein
VIPTKGTLGSALNRHLSVAAEEEGVVWI